MKTLGGVKSLPVTTAEIKENGKPNSCVSMLSPSAMPTSERTINKSKSFACARIR